MNKHVVLDTAKILTCDACEEPIAISDPKTIYGVGSTLYLRVYHRECEPLPISPNDAIDLSIRKLCAD